MRKKLSFFVFFGVWGNSEGGDRQISRRHVHRQIPSPNGPIRAGNVILLAFLLLLLLLGNPPTHPKIGTCEIENYGFLGPETPIIGKSARSDPEGTRDRTIWMDPRRKQTEKLKKFRKTTEIDFQIFWFRHFDSPQKQNH